MLAENLDDAAESPQTLVAGIIAGNQRDEQILITRYWRGLYFILNRRAQNPDLAADLAQDTFIIVLQKIRDGGIENPDALPAFIRQTGVNLLIAHYRKEQRRKTEVDEHIDTAFSEQCADLPTQLNAELLSELVRQVMQELPTERDRQLLSQFFLQGVDKAQLCDNFDLKPEHFDRVLFRARNRLKQLLQHKLKVDIRQVSLSHLLGVVLPAALLLLLQGTPKNNEFLLREQITTLHLDKQVARDGRSQSRPNSSTNAAGGKYASDG